MRMSPDMWTFSEDQAPETLDPTFPIVKPVESCIFNPNVHMLPSVCNIGFLPYCTF